MVRMARRLAAAGVVIVCSVSMLRADTVTDVVGRVSEAYYTSFLRGYTSLGDLYDNPLYTHDTNSRSTNPATTQHDAVRDFVEDRFSAYGLTITLDKFDSDKYSNVVGILPGTKYPDRYYIVGAHYDSVSCPGADDDASGVAGVLEAARVLSQSSFESSIVFIAFDREEAGLLGSDHYADANAAKDIRGMVSMDMIAYNPSGTGARIYGRTASDGIKSALQSALSTYADITATLYGYWDASDHAPFEANSKPACMLIEPSGNPNYHTTSDSVDTANYLNYAYATDMTRGVVGYLAGAAVAVPEPATLALLAVCAAIIAWRTGAGWSRRP